MILRAGKYNEETKTIDIACTECGKQFKIPATKSQYDEIRKGMFNIQEILPNATAEEREMFMTGWCDDCFPSDPDEEE